MIYLWKGHHDLTLKARLKHAWQSDELFILCPPLLKDYSFISFLPEGEIECIGSFSETEKNSVASFQKIPRKKITYPEHAVVGIFTSGTLSAKPRLALYSKRNITFALTGIRSFFEVKKIEAIFCYPPPFHTFGLILGYYQAILHGVTLHISEGRYSRESHKLWSQLREKNLLTLGTPSHFYDLIQYARDHKLTLSESYTAIIGGAKVSVPLWQEIQSVLKIEKPSIGYGATEACPGVTHHPPGLCPKEEGEIGFPIPGVNIILKRDAGIEFSGENVSLAIIENEEIFFPKSIVLEDWIEKRNEDDMLLFRGRLGLLLNRGGTKYSLESIEDCLRKNFGIACAALAVLDERLGEDLGLVIASDTNLDLNHFREKLSAFFLHEYGHSFKLNHITTTRALPLNENGKIDRTQIAKIISAV